jgi:ATP-dependent Clp protease ATP-binding subunit ClpA
MCIRDRFYRVPLLTPKKATIILSIASLGFLGVSSYFYKIKTEEIRTLEKRNAVLQTRLDELQNAIDETQREIRRLKKKLKSEKFRILSNLKKIPLGEFLLYLEKLPKSSKIMTFKFENGLAYLTSITFCRNLNSPTEYEKLISFLKNFKDTFKDHNIDRVLGKEIFEFNQLKNDLNIFDENTNEQVEKETKKSKNSIKTSLEIAKILKRNLPKYVYGQNHAIEKIVDYFKNNLVKKTGPKATFFFMGPPATGKTYLAEVMAKLIKDYKVKVFDMTQFPRAEDGMTLYGSDFKYSDSKPGLLTDFVLKNPKSIIVFDEIEKAHNNIQNALLSIFNLSLIHI